MATRPRSPTPTEIQAILHANDVDFADFLDYHFSLTPEGEEVETEVKANTIDEDGDNGLTSAEQVEMNSGGAGTFYRHAVYLYFHDDAQIWLSHPPAGVPRVDDQCLVRLSGQGKGGNHESFLDRLVDLGIRKLVWVKKRRMNARERRAETPSGNSTNRRRRGGSS